MKRVKVGLWLWALVLLMGWSATVSSAAFFESRHRRKLMPPDPATTSFELNRVGSSVVFPVHGNVYPTGQYNVTLTIGQPPKPYFLDPDTGSDLTWLQCDVPGAICTETPHPLYRPSKDLVGCRDPLCIALHFPKTPKCDIPEQCDYEVKYADGGSSLGVLVKDSFYFNSTNGVQLKPRLALGCGYDQHSISSNHPIDGVLGLGRGKTSTVSQLHSQGLVRNVVGHCLSGRGGGFLFFGDDVYDSSRVDWTPMSRDYTEHYSPGFAELRFDGKPTGLKNLLTVFDSASTYTYLTSEAYQTLTSSVKRDIPGEYLREDPKDEALPLCWKGKRPFKRVSDVRKHFKPLALDFTNGGKTKTYELPPEAYLIISSKGNVCLGILNGSEVGLQNSNIIGGKFSMYM
ncbi:hypothetical protein TIFTF001_047972 [Ficus carica]|uniref:Peptidase A1 domain-containing protein n=1 Tax=Ficus carica TaxID=3494 RepID=A0AA88CU22_FICCA|nr:hypothetical protein TIFTF001_047972 [Ficus carica]